MQLKSGSNNFKQTFDLLKTDQLNTKCFELRGKLNYEVVFISHNIFLLMLLQRNTISILVLIQGDEFINNLKSENVFNDFCNASWLFLKFY